MANRIINSQVSTYIIHFYNVLSQNPIVYRIPNKDKKMLFLYITTFKDIFHPEVRAFSLTPPDASEIGQIT